MAAAAVYSVQNAARQRPGVRRVGNVRSAKSRLDVADDFNCSQTNLTQHQQQQPATGDNISAERAFFPLGVIAKLPRLIDSRPRFTAAIQSLNRSIKTHKAPCCCERITGLHLMANINNMRTRVSFLCTGIYAVKTSVYDSI